MKIKVLYLFFLIIISCQSLAQMLSAEQVKEDFSFLEKEILKYHPDPYKFIAKEKLTFISDSIQQRITGKYSIKDAYLTYLPYVQAIGCGHTHFSLDKRLFSKNNAFGNESRYFPFSVRYINNRLFVSRNYSSDKKLVRGTEILEIDGQPVKKIVDYLASISFYNGDGYNPNARKYYAIREFRKLYYLWKGEVETFSITYRKQGQEKSKTTKIEAQSADFMEKMLEVRYPDVDEDTTGIVSYRMLDSAQKIAMVDVRSFMQDWQSFGKGNFEGETRKIFRKLQENKIENLIIDLRGNAGGFIEYSIFFLRYFANQPFDGYKVGFRDDGINKLKQDYKKFDSFISKEASSRLTYEYTVRNKEGYLESKYQQKQRPHDEFRYNKNTYVLINEGTFSAAALLTSKLYDMGIGTYVGLGCGGAYDGCSAAQFSTIKLPHSGLEVSLPLGKISFNIDSKKYPKPILQPDFVVNPNLDDFLNNEDTVLKYTLNLIKNKVKVR